MSKPEAEIVKERRIEWNREKGDGTIAPAPCAPAAQMGVYVWKCLGCPNCRGFSVVWGRAKGIDPHPVSLSGERASHVLCAHPSFQEPEPLCCPACGTEVEIHKIITDWGMNCRACGFYTVHPDRAELERILRKLEKGAGDE